MKNECVLNWKKVNAGGNSFLDLETDFMICVSMLIWVIWLRKIKCYKGEGGLIEG